MPAKSARQLRNGKRVKVRVAARTREGVTAQRRVALKLPKAAEARLRPAVPLATALLVAALAGCGGDEGAALQALRGDAMASYVPPGGRLLQEDASGEKDGSGLMSKPAEASLHRTFAVGDADAALTATADAARDAGWTLEPPLPGLGVAGRKPGMTFSVSLPPGAEAPRVTVSLTHQRG